MLFNRFEGIFIESARTESIEKLKKSRQKLLLRLLADVQRSIIAASKTNANFHNLKRARSILFHRGNKKFHSLLKFYITFP